MSTSFDFTVEYNLPVSTMTDDEQIAEAMQNAQPYRCAHSGIYAPLGKLEREPGTGMLVLPRYSNGRRSIPFAIAPRRK